MRCHLRRGQPRRLGTIRVARQGEPNGLARFQSRPVVARKDLRRGLVGRILGARQRQLSLQLRHGLSQGGLGVCDRIQGPWMAPRRGPQERLVDSEIRIVRTQVRRRTDGTGQGHCQEHQKRL
mmetsp:Transcript_22963/g.26192  ORF Transcript_22963/g.26192 Transcript_22963/m.26192 type:complete len:123 (-) Transcript_22963:256-624(-)